MDASQWPQGMGLQVMNSMILGDQFTSSAAAAAAAAAKPPQVAEREMRERQRPRQKPSMEQALHCPRCKSTNTKFCYYNNYSLTQPRYFCKTCRRYWTEGGSLRNVPVGGGSRKNKNKTVTAAAVTPAAAAAAAAAATPSSKAQKLFPELNTIWQESSSNSYNLSAMDMLKSSTAVPVPLMPDYAGAGFEGLMQEFMRPPAISFPPDSAAGGSNLMFPLEEQNKGQGGGGGGDSANGYWSGNGMLMGGRGSW